MYPDLCPNIHDEQWINYIPNEVNIFNNELELTDSDRRHLNGFAMTNRLIAMNAYYGEKNANQGASTNQSHVGNNNDNRVVLRLSPSPTVNTDGDDDDDEEDLILF